MKIVPLNDKILVERLEADDKTSGGIILPDTAKEKPKQGKILAVGEGKPLDSGKRATFQVKVGDRVLKHSGDYQLEGEVRAVFTTKAGKVRYVVEHEPGFLHIYSDANLMRMTTQDTK